MPTRSERYVVEPATKGFAIVDSTTGRTVEKHRFRPNAETRAAKLNDQATVLDASDEVAAAEDRIAALYARAREKTTPTS